MEIIKDCMLFNGKSAQIEIPYIDNIQHSDFTKYGYHAYTTIKESAVNRHINLSDVKQYGYGGIYAPYSGQILYLHKDSNRTYTIVCSIDNVQGFMISGLLLSSKPSIDEGDMIGVGQLIGKYSIPNGTIDISYITFNPSKWPVRVYDTTYYKHDPMKLIIGELELNGIYGSQVNYDNISIESDTPHEIQTVFEDSELEPWHDVSQA